MPYHRMKWQKKPSGIWKKGQDEGIERGKAGTKTSNGVGKEEREGGREGEREGERNEIHFYSPRKYKLTMYIFDSLGYTYCSTKQ